MLLYSLFEFKLTRIFLLEQHTGVMYSGSKPFLRHKQWFQWKIPLQIVCHSSFELMGFFSPVTVTTEKRFDTMTGTAFRNGISYYLFISKGGNFDVKQFSEPAKTFPSIGANMSGSIFDGQ